MSFGLNFTFLFFQYVYLCVINLNPYGNMTDCNGNLEKFMVSFLVHPISLHCLLNFNMLCSYWVLAITVHERWLCSNHNVGNFFQLNQLLSYIFLDQPIFRSILLTQPLGNKEYFRISPKIIDYFQRFWTQLCNSEFQPIYLQLNLCPMGIEPLTLWTDTLFTPNSKEDWSFYLSI